MKPLEQSIEEFRDLSTQLVAVRRRLRNVDAELAYWRKERDEAEKQQNEFYKRWKLLAINALAEEGFSQEEVEWNLV